MPASKTARRAPAPRQKGDLFGADRTVYRAVLGAVMSHRLAPGTKLVESALSEALGVPRAVVRMGLLRLAHDRIVELRPNRGAAVASPTIEEARQVYEARGILEGALAEHLCGRLSKPQLAELRRIVDEGESAYAAGDTARWITVAGSFHVRLAEMSGNAVLAEQVRELVSRSNLITALYMREGATVFAGDERRALVELLAQDSAPARRKARAALQALIAGVEKRLRVAPAGGGSGDLRRILLGDG